MRMEELNNNNFIKGTDSVERYLLDTIKAYFNSSGIDDESSKEYIIKKAVERMKEELIIDNAGVVSFNGQTGVVTLTLADLGGEPMIQNKKTAFNVDFGDQPGTACMGNDPRLSDRRIPTIHSHNISEISGLEGLISSINTKIEKSNGLLHIHNNQLVLDMLVYTGNQSTIDLTILDTLQAQVESVINEINNRLTTIEANVNEKMGMIETLNAKYDADIQAIYAYSDATDAALKLELESGLANDLSTAKTAADALINNKIDPEDTEAMIDVLNNTYSYIGEGEIVISSYISQGYNGIFSTTIDVDPAIVTELTTLGLLTNTACHYELYFQYIDPGTGTAMTSPMPHMTVANGAISSIFYAEVQGLTKIRINSLNLLEPIPEHVRLGKVFYRVFAIRDVDYILR